MATPAPTITYGSERLVGLELELDSGNTEFREPRVPTGWQKKSDGSLRRGYEYVLEPPLPCNAVEPKIVAFCNAVTEAHTNIGTRGGFHIHVQAADYDLQRGEFWNIVQLYRHFQPVIDGMVGKSRTNNQFAPHISANATRQSVINQFSLDSLADNRYDARYSRSYSVVNLAMLRCRVLAQRSVEFRQLSPSRKVENVLGWTKLLCAFVDIAAKRDFGPELRAPKTLAGLCAVLETRFPGTNLAEWTRWRHGYMNEEPNADHLSAVVQACRSPHGIYHISRQLNVNLPLALRIAEAAVRANLLRKAGGAASLRSSPCKYVALNFQPATAADLASLEATLLSLVPAVVAAEIPIYVPGPDEEV